MGYAREEVVGVRGWRSTTGDEDVAPGGPHVGGVGRRALVVQGDRESEGVSGPFFSASLHMFSIFTAFFFFCFLFFLLSFPLSCVSLGYAGLHIFFR